MRRFLAVHMFMLHPLTDKAPDDENEIIQPTKEGLLKTLKSSIKNKIKRFVMTSSFSAVGYGNEEKIYDESHWTDQVKILEHTIRVRQLLRKVWSYLNSLVTMKK